MARSAQIHRSGYRRSQAGYGLREVAQGGSGEAQSCSEGLGPGNTDRPTENDLRRMAHLLVGKLCNAVKATDNLGEL